MDEKKELQTAIPEEEETAVKKFDIKTAIDIWALIKTVLVIGASAAMTYLTVWLEYNWLAQPREPSYANMLRYWLVTSNGANSALFYSLIVCGFIIWAVIFAAIAFLITKLVRVIIKKIDAKKAARG